MTREIINQIAAMLAERERGKWRNRENYQEDSENKGGKNGYKSGTLARFQSHPPRLRAESIIGDQLEGEEREKAIKALEGALG